MEDLKKKEEKKSENIIVLEEEKDLDEKDFSYDEEALNQYLKTFSLFKQEQKKQVQLKRKERREAIVSNLAPSENSNDKSSLGDRVTSVKQELAGEISKSVVSKTIVPVLKREPEDVSRKSEKGKSTSKDKKYKNDVIDATNKVLKEVGQALKEKGGDPKVRNAQVEKLMIHRKTLVIKHTHYGDLEGAKKKLQGKKKKEEEINAFLKQRELKCAGIQQRMNEIDKVIHGIDQIDDRAEDEMAHSIGSSMNELSKIKDDKERGKQAKPLASVLDSNTEPTVTYSISGKKTDDEETLKRKKVESQFKQKVLAQCRDNKSLISILDQVHTSNQSSVVKELLAVHGKDTARMDDLCEKAFAEELKESNNEGDYLRKDSLATKLSGQYHRNCPNGKEYLATSLNGSKDQIRKLKDEDLEIDPNKVKEEDKKKIPERKEALKKLTINTVKSITKTPPPPEMSKVCTQIYDDYMKKFNDERGALVKVGGHLLLRCVNPELTDAVKNPDPNASDEEKNMQKTTTILTKVLQNISNQVSFGVKEKHLDEFNELVGTTEEEDDGTNTGKKKKVFKPGELTKMMQEYFKQVVEEGRKAKSGGEEEEENKDKESSKESESKWTAPKKKATKKDEDSDSSEEEKDTSKRFLVGNNRKRRGGVKLDNNPKIEEELNFNSSKKDELDFEGIETLTTFVGKGNFKGSIGVMTEMFKVDSGLAYEVAQLASTVMSMVNSSQQPNEEMYNHLVKLVSLLPGEVGGVFQTEVLSRIKM